MAAPSAAARRRPITREYDGDEAIYRLQGRRITRTAEIERLNALAVPPAWRDVEIARSPRAKVLATGVDAAGRTQAIYHPAYRRRREREKFDRMVRFAESLPAMRARVDRDLRRRRLSRDRVIACVVRVIDEQFFRVGNAAYASRGGGRGVTTLEWEHVTPGAEAVRFDFVGKSGRRQRRMVRDARVARVIARLESLPGDEVFRFFDEDGLIHRLDSRHVNAYVKRHMGEEFTAKDFRTWGGTVVAASALFSWARDVADDSGSTDDASDAAAESRDAAAARRRAIALVAERLGNTPAVAKSSYIDPRVLQAFENPAEIARVHRVRLRARRYLSVDEQRVLLLLRED
ncbi:DNA topoisomerase IB [Leucobacter sp. gxy201]|uniref:DNA topoisomerase IB n=1 Tax=Leucobacter sp. gxy201 TaxID=2957200 RepID=UPI003DA03A6B